MSTKDISKALFQKAKNEKQNKMNFNQKNGARPQTA